MSIFTTIILIVILSTLIILIDFILKTNKISKKVENLEKEIHQMRKVSCEKGKAQIMWSEISSKID